MNLNVTDLRKKKRRSPKDQDVRDERRKTSDRRTLPAEPRAAENNVQRIWLTSGERTLIEDLYLLEDKDVKPE